MAPMSTKPLVAFYGATGGCTLAAATNALNEGYDCTALARTPSKLTNLLLSKGVSQEAIDNHLTITKGDVLKVEDVKGPLTLKGRPADIIISGIGIVNGMDIFYEVKLCENASITIIEALKQLKTSKKPVMVVISTTGLTTTGPRDVPLLFKPMYDLFIANVAADKRRMEAALASEYNSSNSVIKGYVCVRPSLLTNGQVYGKDYIRVGTDAAPAVGYTISRDDVGLWLFENLIKGDNTKYLGEAPTITY